MKRPSELGGAGGVRGKFYGVGVGPGDPELITLKAVRALKESDVICAPVSGAPGERIALSVVAHLIEGKEVVELSFPMTKDAAVLEQSWQRAAGRIMEMLRSGRVVAFVTLGDPTLYSTYSYVLRKIAGAGPWDVETVPGVPSFCACAAAAGVPLAEGNEKLAVIPAPVGETSLRGLLRSFENLVLLKVNRSHREIAGVLGEFGLIERSFLASRLGLKGEMVCRLDEFLKESAGRQPDYLSLIVVKNKPIS